MTMGDRIAVMNEGRIQQLAPPREAYRRPANLFVAEFIGSPSMNLIEGTVEGGSFESTGGDVDVALPDDRAAAASSDRLTLGVRPESIQVVESPDEFAVTGRVDVVEHLGNLQVIYVEAGDERILAETDPDLDVESGEEISIRFPPEKLHLFDGTDPESARLPATEGVEAEATEQS